MRTIEMNPVRYLQGDEQCTGSTSLNTTYNANKKVIPYTGIMFEVYSKDDPLEILTLELDVRLDEATDLSVEIYTLRGEYEFFVNDTEAWTLVAETEAVPAPEGSGAIIPVDKFQTVSMKARERRSFYITMKGPFLDNNVYALHKTGEIQTGDGQLDVFVGAGLTEYKFPGELDTRVDPQFAGVIYYRRTLDCNKLVIATNVEFQFVLNKATNIALLADVSAFVDEAVEKIMEDDDTIQSYRTKFGLQKKGVAETTPFEYDGGCLAEWEWDGCPSTYLSTKVTFLHLDGLDSGAILHQLYRYPTAITVSLKQQLDNVDVRYIGLESVKAGFRLSLEGVPAGHSMSDTQKRYFNEITSSFLATTLVDAKAVVLGVEIEEQTFQDRRLGNARRLGNNNATIRVEGNILGAQATFLEEDDFAKSLQTTFVEQQLLYAKMLAFGGLRPSEIGDSGDYDYFLYITGVSGRVESIDVSQASGDALSGGGADLNTKAIVMGAGVGGGVLFLFGLVFLRRYLKRRIEYNKDLESYREKMKLERRSRRETKKMLQAQQAVLEEELSEEASAMEESGQDVDGDESVARTASYWGSSDGLEINDCGADEADDVEQEEREARQDFEKEMKACSDELKDRDVVTQGESHVGQPHFSAHEDSERSARSGTDIPASRTAPEGRAIPSRSLTRSFEELKPKREIIDRRATRSFSEGIPPDQPYQLPEFLGRAYPGDDRGMLHPVQKAEDNRSRLPKQPRAAGSSAIMGSERSNDSPSLGKFMDRQPPRASDPLSDSRSFHPSRSIDRIGKLKPVKEAEDIRRVSPRLPPQRSRSDDGTRFPPRRPPQRTRSGDTNGLCHAEKRSSDNPSLGKMLVQQSKPKEDPLSGSRSFHPSRSVDRSGKLRPVREAEDIPPSLPKRPSMTVSNSTSPSEIRDVRRSTNQSLGSFMDRQPKRAIDPLSGSRSFHPSRSVDRSGLLKPVKEAEDIRRVSPRLPPQRTRSDDGTTYPLRQAPHRTSSGDATGLRCAGTKERSLPQKSLGTNQGPSLPHMLQQQRRPEDGMSSSRSVDYAADHGRNDRPKHAKNTGSLSAYMNQQPKMSGNLMSGSRSVGGIPNYQREIVQRHKERPSRAPPEKSASFDMGKPPRGKPSPPKRSVSFDMDNRGGRQSVFSNPPRRSRRPGHQTSTLVQPKPIKDSSQSAKDRAQASLGSFFRERESGRSILKGSSHSVSDELLMNTRQESRRRSRGPLKRSLSCDGSANDNGFFTGAKQGQPDSATEI